MSDDMFKDKKYEEMDWLAKACEPYTYSLNKVFTAIPDEIDVTYEDFEKSIIDNDGRYMNLYCSTKLKAHNLTDNEIDIVKNHFELECSDEISIDVENQVMTGYAKLKKNKRTLDDKDMAKIISAKASSYYSGALGWNTRNLDIKRMNEIIELLEVGPNARSSRSARRKERFIRTHLESLMRKDTYKIRDVDLALNFCKWVGMYLKTGNVAAFKNVCTLKILTHEGGPIYSISEDEV